MDTIQSVIIIIILRRILSMSKTCDGSCARITSKEDFGHYTDYMKW